MLRKISAHYIFPGKGNPLKKGVVVVNSEGEIIDLIDTQGNLQESEKLEFYNGIIAPGFVNAHTHLELSHLKGKINQHTGLAGFIRNIGQLRHPEISKEAIIDADSRMQSNGIVAAGDISNSGITFLYKAKSKIRYYTFIEIFGIQNHIARERMNFGAGLLEMLKTYQLAGTLVPHAPYSISNTLWQLLSQFTAENGLKWSIHNQESDEENQLFLNKTGKISNFLAAISDEFDGWEAPGITSLKYCKRFYKNIPFTLLVHNTFISASDLDAISDLKDKICLVLCPKANLYIENVLPDIEMLSKSGFRISLGTDSLASNTDLSILEEMKVIQQYFPAIPLKTLLEWGTINGALALDFENELGSIEINKKPGLNLLTNINFNEMKLTSHSEVKVLI